MKKSILTLGFLILANFIFGQVPFDSLVQQGVQYHDAGEYQKAIDIYKKALEIDPNSTLVNYEISYTYMMMEDYDNALKHSNIVIEKNDENQLGGYIVTSSCLDYQGKTDESIKLLEKAIKKFKTNYLLYYNLAISYYNKKDLDKAIENSIAAINLKSSHASSHLLLGKIMCAKGNKIQGILSLHYFLFLEPNTARSKEAYALLMNQIGGNVTKDPNKPNQINISMSMPSKDDEFGAAEMSLALLQASGNIEENKNKTDEEMFAQNTEKLFKILGEMKKKNSKGLWWEFYVPFDYELAQSQHMTTYCYLISYGSNDKSKEWVDNNRDKLESFGTWLDVNLKKSK
jgi:tetratricopeptide (TPR) repeat protein